MAIEFNAYIRPRGTTNEPWKEHYVRDTDDAEACARDIVDYFNSTLRPGERPRELVRVEVIATVAPHEHDWEKMNLTTKMFNGRPYDIVRCTRCKITGKRWGLARARRDSQFKAQVYARCDTTLTHRAKMGVRLTETASD